MRVSAALAAALAFATVALGARTHPQHDLQVSSHARTVAATPGTHCTERRGTITCEDARYPLRTRRRLPVHGRGRIVLRFAEPPEEIDASLRDRRSRSVYELRAPRGRGLERTLRLPRRLPRGTDRLGVWAGYEVGDADFEVDLRRHRHRRR